MSATNTPHVIEAQKLYEAGVKALRKNNLLEAEKAFAEAIALYETNAEYWLKLGLVWSKMNRLTEATEANTMAVSLAPDSPDAHYNLGLSLLAAGLEDSGIQSLQDSFRLSPQDDLAEKLADYFYNAKDFKSAAYYYLQIYTHKKALMKEQLLDRLATALYRNGDLQQALGITLSLVKRFPQNSRYSDLLLDLYRRVPHTEFNQDAKDILERFLKSGKTKFLFLRNPWVSLFLLDPLFAPLHIFLAPEPKEVDLAKLARALKSDFLCLGIQRGLATSIQIETLLTNLRRYFLLNWREAEKWPDTLFRFLSSLAVSCWYNDFVYFETKEEKDELIHLKGYLLSRLNEVKSANQATPADALQLALLACYVPLCEFCTNETVLPVPKKLAADFAPLELAQLSHPLAERALMPTIPYFTTVEDKTSLSVQAMYMARPYPRWISTSTPTEPKHSNLPPLDILVAGCGTGHEPALYANVLPSAHITAIDLSPASVAYAKRMASQLRIDNRIDFFLGDLMKAPELVKKFDFVASSGVLHHLKQPEKGLEAILQTLKEDGVLSISLYSKHARDHTLNPASDYIKEKGYSASTDDIRQFRRDVMMMSPDNPVFRCTSAGDFYFLSECNDLLFHVQEHRYTPRMIWEMADRHGLTPFHISMTSDRLKAFLEMFPGEDPLNPDLLEKFEEAHPKAFIEMYKIFLRRKTAPATSPLDTLIKAGNL